MLNENIKQPADSLGRQICLEDVVVYPQSKAGVRHGYVIGLRLDRSGNNVVVQVRSFKKSWRSSGRYYSYKKTLTYPGRLTVIPGMKLEDLKKFYGIP